MVYDVGYCSFWMHADIRYNLLDVYSLCPVISAPIAMPDADSAFHSCFNTKVDCVLCTGAAHSIYTRIEQVAKTRYVYHASCPYTTKAWCFSDFDLLSRIRVHPPSSWLLFPLFVFRNATIQNGSTQNRQTKFHNGGGQPACVCVCLDAPYAWATIRFRFEYCALEICIFGKLV